ncbi:putative Hsp70 nucleotide exchange factor fes1 [Coniochaeta ligniaria NRRL 30616]|uniref:Putative Hsp70 nucleotide exchange factor fes1 n=1 Tax=Coniochaeta ligniaria NRRL 30616 TaxID=1408157 RepID=A0A1J7IR36_9PEZI|nr:putative Hsp70 nucleotide exchange factor fes1 [Coniochaeta ligniaria NRRL 30616]
MSKNLNDLLKWSIENTVRPEDTPEGREAPGTAPTTNDIRTLDPELLKALMGGPSDAELMKAAMEVITSPDPEVTHDTRVTAFDNLEQLIESLDNANNLSNLALWTPLVDLLSHAHPDFRRYAAWCVGTAVQNNAPSQEKFMVAGGVPKLVELAAGDEETDDQVKRKAVYALSSAVRNYQPAMDVAHQELGKRGLAGDREKVDATDMDAIDEIMKGLRERLSKA